MVGPVAMNEDLRNLPYIPPEGEYEERRLTRYPVPAVGFRRASRVGDLRIRPETAQKSLPPDPDDAGATVHI